jgi:single-stranded-DNA-specific exonuclease
MAAGITVRKDALAAFRAFLDSTLATAVEAARRDEALLIDGAVAAAGAGFELCDLISRAGPFGAGNSEPILAFPAHTIAYAEDRGQSHIQVRIKAGEGTPLPAIAFRAAGEKLGDALLAARGRRMHVAGTLTLDRWQGTERAQLRIIDIAPAEPW